MPESTQHIWGLSEAPSRFIAGAFLFLILFLLGRFPRLGHIRRDCVPLGTMDCFPCGVLGTVDQCTEHCRAFYNACFDEAWGFIAIEFPCQHHYMKASSSSHNYLETLQTVEILMRTTLIFKVEILSSYIQFFLRVNTTTPLFHFGMELCFEDLQLHVSSNVFHCTICPDDVWKFEFSTAYRIFNIRRLQTQYINPSVDFGRVWGDLDQAAGP